MSENSLKLYDQAIMPTTFDGMMKQADVLAKSGLLPQTVRTGAAAAAIMLAGRELGIPPMQSFRTIYVVKGNVSLSAQLMAALVLRAGHGYELIENSNTRCAITFTRRGGATYTHEFTLDDAKRAGLVNGDNWQKYPKAMLWSRCMSAGIRAFLPDVIMGMYTPEELAGGDGIVVDDDGEVIDVVAKDVTPEPEPETPKADSNGRTPPSERPWTPEQVRAIVTESAASRVANGKATDSTAQSHLQGAIAARISELFPNDAREIVDMKRHALLYGIFGKKSTKELTDAECRALLAWASEKLDDGQWVANEDASVEAQMIVESVEAEAGQQKMM